MCKQYIILYKGLEHLGICDGPGANPRNREDCQRKETSFPPYSGLIPKQVSPLTFFGFLCSYHSARVQRFKISPLPALKTHGPHLVRFTGKSSSSSFFSFGYLTLSHSLRVIRIVLLQRQTLTSESCDSHVIPRMTGSEGLIWSEIPSTCEREHPRRKKVKLEANAGHHGLCPEAAPFSSIEEGRDSWQSANTCKTLN